MLVTLALTTTLAATDPMSIGQGDHGRPERDPKIDKDFGLDAPLVEVDRFSDAAGTLFRRSVDPTLPAARAPFSLDDPRFRMEVTGPDGSKASCYNLDVRPPKPNRFYVFYDSLNNYRLGQFPVIGTVPGDPGYSDVWDIWKVITPDAFYETNWLRDAATLEKLLADPASGFTAQSTGVYLNAPVVPEGTAASMKAEARSGGATQRYFAWYRGQRAPYLYFEGSLKLTPEGTVPLRAKSGAWPKSAGYSPLTSVAEGIIDCPIVGTAP